MRCEQTVSVTDICVWHGRDLCLPCLRAMCRDDLREYLPPTPTPTPVEFRPQSVVVPSRPVTKVVVATPVVDEPEPVRVPVDGGGSGWRGTGLARGRSTGGDLVSWVARTIVHDQFIDAIYELGPLDDRPCAVCGDPPEAQGGHWIADVYLCKRCEIARRLLERINRPEPSGMHPATARYWRLKAEGLCTGCGLRTPRVGRVTCQACANAQAARAAWKHYVRVTGAA